MNKGKDWIYQTNVYEVNIRQYTQEGTFTAFVKHLPRLKKMGVHTLWLMPITPISQKEKKGSLGSPYACSDYTAINPEFGTAQDLKQLVAEAHKLGFKLMIDWVANHTGWDHVWTVAHPEWYEKDEATGGFKKASGMDDIIELDFSNAAMRQAMIAAMQYWVEEFSIDGFRCDLAFWVQLDFWVDAKAAMDKVKPLFWLAEADFADNPDYAQVFDAAYTWRWMHKTDDFCKNHLSFQELLQVLHQYGQAPGVKAWFTSNHDENTWNGTEYEKYGYLAKALAVFSCTWPGVPLLYSGQEAPNKKRLAFFDKDPIEWNEEMGLHEFYRTLLELQTKHPALHAHATTDKLNTSADDRVVAYQRSFGSAKVVTVINFSNAPIHVTITDRRFYGDFELVISSTDSNSHMRHFTLEAGGFVVLKSK